MKKVWKRVRIGEGSNQVFAICKGRSYLSEALQVVRPELEYHVAAWFSWIKANKNKDCLERVQRNDINMVGTRSAGTCDV